MKIYKLAAVLTAVALAFSCAACSQKKSKKSKSAKKNNTSSTAADESAQDEIVTDGEVDSVTSQDGVHIRQAYDLLKSDQYRIKLTYTDASGGREVFTAAEWNKLLGLWNYTGDPEAFLKQQSASVLRGLVNQ